MELIHREQLIEMKSFFFCTRNIFVKATAVFLYPRNSCETNEIKSFLGFYLVIFRSVAGALVSLGDEHELIK